MQQIFPLDFESDSVGEIVCYYLVQDFSVTLKLTAKDTKLCELRVFLYAFCG